MPRSIWEFSPTWVPGDIFIPIPRPATLLASQCGAAIVPASWVHMAHLRGTHGAVGDGSREALGGRRQT